MKQRIKDFFGKNGHQAALVSLCVVLVVVIGLGTTGIIRKAAADKEVLTSLNDNAAQIRIFVHVKGAVANEGLYELRRGDRMCDAITAAGGLSPQADSENINLAEFVEDGQEITIPAANAERQDTQGRININTASMYELMSLPGIGETYAKRIIEYREQNGNFTNIQQLKKVKGFGGKNFEKLQDLITVE